MAAAILATRPEAVTGSRAASSLPRRRRLGGLGLRILFGVGAAPPTADGERGIDRLVIIYRRGAAPSRAGAVTAAAGAALLHGEQDILNAASDNRPGELLRTLRPLLTKP